MNANDLEDFLNSLEHMYFKDIDELHKYAAKYIEQTKDAPLPDFEGYSPNEMTFLFYNPYDDKSPMKLQTLDDSDYKRIPIFNLIKYLANRIVADGEIKLTQNGNLPKKIVSELYSQGFIEDYFIENGLSKPYYEEKIEGIHLTRIILQLSGMTKKRNNKISLTLKGNRLLSNNDELLKLIFKTFTQKFNWGYFDLYETEAGQMGFAFSLFLVSKYGDTKRLDKFYAKKYFNAFPKFLDSSEFNDVLSEEKLERCYSIRTFDRFMDYFGLIQIDADDKIIPSEKFITKTDLLDKFIHFEPHQSILK